MTKLLVLTIFATISLAHGLNILAIFPLSMKSHYAIGFSVIDSLLHAGHNVTALSTLKPEKPLANYRVIPLPDVMEEFKEQEPNPFEYVNFPTVVSILTMPQFGSEMVNLVMQSEELREFLAADADEFDVCVMELFSSEALLVSLMSCTHNFQFLIRALQKGIPEKFNCALLFYLTFDSYLWSDGVSGNQSPASYVSSPYLHYTDKMTFRERLWNGFVSLFDKALYYGYHIPQQRHLYNKYFPNAKRSFDDMYRNASIIFINNHVSNSFPRPHQPSQIEIGGIHVKPAKTLPADLQEFLDSATEGAIVFSMGSYIDGTDWPLEKREAFVRVFGRLKQRVIWRYSNDTLPGNPGNIKIASWLPQRDILAHKNVKLFITHGGLLGTTEAIVEGVPVLGIPIFGDQLMNIAKVSARGYGLQLSFNDITEESIGVALRELLTNAKYKETAVRVSKRFNDRDLTPQQTVVYWTEFVARHQGASHLQAEAVNLSFIEFHSLDVFGVLLAILLVVVYTKFLLARMMLRKISRKIFVTKPKRE